LAVAVGLSGLCSRQWGLSRGSERETYLEVQVARRMVEACLMVCGLAGGRLEEEERSVGSKGIWAFKDGT
jgi:hypothetical protein